MKRNQVLKSTGVVGFTLLLIFALAWTPCAGESKNPLPKRVSFATHKVGTSNNALGTALCKVASEQTKMLVVVKPGSGSSAWIPTLSSKGIPELGFTTIHDVWWAYSGKLTPVPVKGDPLGKKPFYKAHSNLRVLVAGPRMWIGFIAKNDAPFKTLADAKGSRLAGGYVAARGVYALLVAALRNGTCDPKDFKQVVVPGPGLGVRALMEGRVDLALASIGMPVVTEANARLGVRFLPQSDKAQDIKALQEVFPGGTVRVRKPGPPGLKTETPLFTYPLMVTTSTHLPDYVAYALAKAWWDGYKDTWSMHPACKGWSPKDFVVKNTTVPYHAGAVKFYKEKGLWSAEMDEVQKQLLDGKYPFLTQ